MEDMKMTALLAGRRTDAWEFIRSVLEKEGWRVEKGARPSDAGLVAKQIHPDLVLLDHDPSGSWRETVQAIKSNWPFAHVVLVAKRDAAPSLETTLESGADDLLHTPISGGDLVLCARRFSGQTAS